jgi:predicted dehydrogenase
MSIRIAAVGFSHNHIYNQVNALLKEGAELVWCFDAEPERMAESVTRYPQAKQARSLDEIFDDDTIHLIVSAAIPLERAPLGIRAMQRGKDYLCAKPGFVSLEQLEEARRVQAETGRIYAVYYGERFGNPATVKAGELVHSGAIGQVIQTTGFGPHKLLGHVFRPDWVFDKRYFGGILNDLASHQIDQFLYFTGSESAEIVTAQVGNFKHTQFPLIEDFGDLMIRSERATGYIRVDWLTPPGLPTWGDVRLFLLGTDGYIELRKNCDITGREGTDHLFLVNQQAPRYIPCADVPMPYGQQLIYDVLHRTETAMTQEHCFRASELALIAQKQATRLEVNEMQAKTV